MPLSGETAEVEEVDILVSVNVAWYMEEEADKAEEAVVAMAVVQEVTVLLNMELAFHMLPVTFKMNSGPYYQIKQEEGYWRNPHALI